MSAPSRWKQAASSAVDMIEVGLRILHGEPWIGVSPPWRVAPRDTPLAPAVGFRRLNFALFPWIRS